MKRIGTILILLLLFLPLSAEGEYTLDALIGAMVVNNTDIRKADESVVQSNLDVKDAEAAYYPTIDLSLMGIYMPNPPIDPIVINTADLGLPLSTDLTVYDGLESTFYGAAISFTQPIVTWGKITNSVKLYKAVAAARSMQRSDLEKQLVAELKARLTALYYMDLMDSLLDETIRESQSLLELVRAGEEEGALLRSDILDAEIEAKEAEIAKKEIDGKRENLIQSVRTITGLDGLTWEDISYVPDECEVDTIMNYSIDSLISLATSPSSPSLQMIGKSKEALEYGKKIANASMYGVPDIGLNVRAGYGGSRFPFIEKNWSEKDDWFVSIALAFTTTLWDGGKALNQVNRLKSQMRASDADYDAAVDSLSTAVVNAYSAIDLSRTKMEYQEIKVENGRAKVEDAEMKKALGSFGESDVLQARLSLISDEISLYTEKMTMFQNCYVLYYLTGLDSENPPIITDGMV